MKKKQLKLVILCIICVILLFLIFDDRYIYNNISKIDQTDTISIISGNNYRSYDFNDKMIDLVSYGGLIMKRDNLFEGIFMPYSDQLNKMDLTIDYKKGDSTLGTAQVFYSNVDPNKYILYMNNIYWTTNSDTNDLLELIQ
jgi:hypothetical protein